MRICSKKLLPLFTSLMCSCRSNIKSVGLLKNSELIACLLVAEKNNELLLQNHQSRPTGFKVFPEANATFASPHSNRQGQKKWAV